MTNWTKKRTFLILADAQRKMLQVSPISCRKAVEGLVLER